MGEFDLKVADALSVLAAIVNRAGRPEAVTAASTQVPTKLLYEAKAALSYFKDSEFTTHAIGQACNRSLS